MGEQMEANNFSEIVVLMNSPESSDRRMAASMLADTGGDAAIEKLLVLLQDENSGVRDAAQNTLTFIGGRTAVEKIVPLLKMTDLRIRNASIDILRKIGEEGLDILKALVQHENDNVRLFVLDILGTIGNPESLDVLVAGLKDPNPNVRNAAVVSLGMLGDERAFEPLKTMIDDEEWIRFSAIEALSQIPHEGAADFLMTELTRWSGDDLTVAAILETLGKLKYKQCVGPLIELIETTNEYIETSIVQTLLKLLSPDEIASLHVCDTHIIKSILDRHLTDAGDELLTNMLMVLSRIGDQKSIRAMIDLARTTDPDAQIEQWSAITDALSTLGDTTSMIELLDMDDKLKILASNVLAHIGNQAGAREIARRIFSCQGYVKRAMTYALASIGGTSLRETFLRLMKDTDGHVISSSLHALGTFANPEDIAEIEPFLDHPYPDVREVAFESVIRIGTKQAEELFARMIDDQEPSRRITGLRGLSRMKSSHLGEAAHRLLKGENREARATAVRVIRDESLPLGMDMIEVLLCDDYEQIRYMAIDIVGMRRIHELRPYLEHAITGEDIWAASHAIEGLSKFRDEQAKERLTALLTGSSDFLRLSAAKALGQWGDEALSEALEPLLDHPNPDVARAVADALDRLQGVSF
jgi:HEAT repeat protein